MNWINMRNNLNGKKKEQKIDFSWSKLKYTFENEDKDCNKCLRFLFQKNV